MIAYLMMAGSIANIGAFASFYGWAFDTKDIFISSEPRQGLAGSLPTYIYMEMGFKFVRGVCYYSGEVCFIL